MEKTDPNLVMHKLLGQHEYADQWNDERYFRELVCVLCGHKEKGIHEPIAQNLEKLRVLFQNGMISINDFRRMSGLEEASE